METYPPLTDHLAIAIAQGKVIAPQVNLLMIFIRSVVGWQQTHGVNSLMVFEDQRGILTPADRVKHNTLTLLGDSENLPLKNVMTGVHKAATGRQESEKRQGKLIGRCRRLLCLVL